MKAERSIMAVVAVALLLAVTTPAGASLLKTIGTADYYNGAAKVGTYNLIYDPEAPNIVNGVYQGTHGIVWLDYTRRDVANVDPLSDTWQNQMAWANGLNGSGTYTITNYVLNTGYSMNWDGSSWRLPSTVDNNSSLGTNVTTAEMGHLYYTELGKPAGGPLGDPAPFTNLVSGVSSYWSGTEYAITPGDAWDFDFSTGTHFVLNESGSNYALAVRPGLLETSAVPEPSTYLLLGISLGVVGYARRRLSAR